MAQRARWVIKIGSALLTNDGRGLDRDLMQVWVDRMVALRERGIDVMVVSSGAVAEGMTRLGWARRPDSVHQLQAAAAVGQMGLVQAWESCFQKHRLHTAQVLLTHDDLSDRKRYLNARSTLLTLLGFSVVPVVNENDTVVTDEIRFGDNDTLAALVANLVEAERLVILTDQDGLFDADPRQNPAARLIPSARASDPALAAMAGGGGSGLGRGGIERIGAVIGVVKAAPACIGGIEDEAVVERRHDELRACHGCNLGIDILRADFERRGFGDKIADFAQERLIGGSVMRLAHTPVVPCVDLDLQILALDEQSGILRREFAQQAREIGPELGCIQPRPRQRALLDEDGQSRIDGQAGTVEKFGHASTLWSARLRQWTRGGKGRCAMPRLDSIGNGRFSMRAA